MIKKTRRRYGGYSDAKAQSHRLFHLVQRDFPGLSFEDTTAGKLRLDQNDGQPVPLAQIPTPLTGKDADTTDGKHLPSTVADLLTDHDKAAHDALKIDADTVDGYHAVDLLGYTIVSKAFTYTFSSPLLIITALDGWVIVDAWIEITTAWTGLVPGLSVGDASDVDGYLIDANINESKAGYYGFELDNRGAYLWDISEKHVRQKIYTTSTAINVYKIGSPGAGAATVYLGIIRLKQER